MKMITLEVSYLVEDDTEAEVVANDVTRSINYMNEYDDQSFVGCDWFDVDVTSERPYASEEEQ